METNVNLLNLRKRVDEQLNAFLRQLKVKEAKKKIKDKQYIKKAVDNIAEMFI